MPIREYAQGQGTFLPMNLDDGIGPGELVRVVSDFVDQLPGCVAGDGLGKEMGRARYSPRMMLKVILYGYINHVYSCRRIAASLRRDLHFMWLAAGETPDFNTINRYRSVHLAPLLGEIFAHMAELLLKSGHIRGEDYFVDGTKIQADASSTSYVWAKNVERHSKKIQERAQEILREVEEINRAEDEQLGQRDLPQTGDGCQALSAQEIAAAAQEVAASATKQEDPQQAKQLRKAAAQLEHQAQRLEAYEAQAQTLGERNSYSKTDPDATFMYTKEKLLRPCYNLQVGTENGFILGCSLSQFSNDCISLIPHLEQCVLGVLPFKPLRAVADAGFGYEEVYVFLESQGIDGRGVAPRETATANPYDKSRFTYDAQRDVWICPRGQILSYTHTQTETYKSGYQAQVRCYAGVNCAQCPAFDQCVRSGSRRTLSHSPVRAHHMDQARRFLESAEGRKLYNRRGWESETRFALMKHNHRMRRVHLRGLEKATADVRYVALAMNLIRRHRITQDETRDNRLPQAA